MPLFGKKKDKTMDLPEVVDFSNDTWSYKGEVPVYQIQSDGFAYDVMDADGNDKNAISLGISGMLVIVLNAKSPKIREDELLPHFGKVIKTRNWHSMTVKEANFLVQTAIKKLSSSAMSGDVFDLASYAPLEVKRVLLKELFTISRTQMKPEFREEAEHRIIDDIVPGIFANPEYELALLTGLIVKPDAKAKEQISEKLETSPVLDPDPRYSRPTPQEIPVANIAAEDSAFAELQRIYGRKPEPVTPAPASAPAAPQPVAEQEAPSQPSESPSRNDAQSESQPAAPAFGTPQPANPFARTEPKNVPQALAPNFGVPQPNNPFAQNESGSIPQPQTPNFGAPPPNNPFWNADGMPAARQGAGIPQPQAPGFGMQQNMPYGAPNMQPNMPAQNQAYPYQGNFPPYPGQPWQQNPQAGQGMPNQGPQQPFYPGQMRPQYPQMPPNMGGAYPQPFNPAQGPDGNMSQGMNPGRNPQQPYRPSEPTTAENA